MEKPFQYMQAFNSLMAASQKLTFLPDFISTSPFAKTAEFNKPARATDRALHTWIKTLYAFWLSALDRTIYNSNDGINGRKHLLEFLSDSMEPLHEAIEFETLDNMLRKVQKEVRIQVVPATHWLNRSAGVSYSRVFLGRSLSSLATASNFAWLCTDKSVPLGKYWRSNPFVFSLLPRCWCNSLKRNARDFADHRNKHQHWSSR